MIKITILTLFPEFINSIREYGVLGKAINKGIINLEVYDIRDFSEDKHKRVDDEIYGGGAGMLMTPQPIFDSLKFVSTKESKILYMSPQGAILTQKKCMELSNEKHLVILCGHYEGIDSRIVNNYIDEEISIGDYVVTGGEIPSLVLIDSVCRMIDGVLGNSKSAITDSHYNGLLQYDVYTRPRIFNNLKVPDVLFSGNHKEIEEWKKQSSIKNTKIKRPDLIKKYEEEKEDSPY